MGIKSEHKRALFLTVILLLVPGIVYGQIDTSDNYRDSIITSTKRSNSNTPTRDTITVHKAKESIYTDTVGTITGEDDEFVNPFATDNGISAQTEDSSFQVTETDDQNWLQRLNLEIDVSAGVTISHFTVEPNYISVKNEAGYRFSAGFLIPIGKVVFARATAGYMRVSGSMCDSLITGPDSRIVSGVESADYFTGNVELGLWWQNDRFVPYMYGIIMPAYLTSAVLIGREKTENTIQNITFGKTTLVNRDLTEKRERSQYFAGGGVGFSFFYGYGMLYCEAQVIYSLRDCGNIDSMPKRNTSRILCFPILLGLRFYL